uniref:Fam-a protein n=1 Tax=Strongyloides venezuelensis TaxID=75913 RepID=A0A0K0FH90_STRVS
MFDNIWYRYIYPLKIFILLSFICNLTITEIDKYYSDKDTKYYLLSREKKDTDAVSEILENSKKFFQDGKQDEVYKEYNDYDYYEDVLHKITHTKEMVTKKEGIIELDDGEDQLSTTGLHTFTSIITTTDVLISTTEISTEKISITTLPNVVTTMILHPLKTKINSSEKISQSTSLDVVTTKPIFPVLAEKIIPNEDRKNRIPARALSIYFKVLEELKKHNLQAFPDTVNQVHNYRETLTNNTIKLEDDIKKLTIT